MSGWEGVRDPRDRRRVVYWRALDGSGAVSLKPEGWRALLYQGRERPGGAMLRTELGFYPSKRTAQRAVDHADTERRCAMCGGPAWWADEAWVCNRCGSEWNADHGPEYAGPGDVA